MQNSKSDEQLNPLNDYLFYMVMGEQGDEVQLISFLNAVLCKSGKKIDAIESFENRYLAPDIINGKGCILDVRVRLHDRTIINIELQIENERNMGATNCTPSRRVDNQNQNAPAPNKSHMMSKVRWALAHRLRCGHSKVC